MADAHMYTPTICSRGDRRRSTRNATASWKPPDSNVKLTANKAREELRASHRDVGQPRKADSVIPQLSERLWNDVDSQNSRLRPLNLAATEIAGDDSGGKYLVYVIHLCVAESFASTIEYQKLLEIVSVSAIPLNEVNPHSHFPRLRC